MIDFVPAELKELDERCKTWARVCRDVRHRTGETMLYRMMKLYGADEDAQHVAEEERSVPLSREQIDDAWVIERAWRRLPIRFQTPLLAWYFTGRSVREIRGALHCGDQVLAERLRQSLRALGNVLQRFEPH